MKYYSLTLEEFAEQAEENKLRLKLAIDFTSWQKVYEYKNIDDTSEYTGDLTTEEQVWFVLLILEAEKTI